MTTVGSRAQVYHGTAHHTSGGLTKGDLKKNKHGEIVSKKASESAKKRFKSKKFAAVRKVFLENAGAVKKAAKKGKLTAATFKKLRA